MVRTALLGFPRIGPDRELKRALESYWRGETDAAELERVAATIRAGHLRLAADLGIDVVPTGDFSLYDHVLDTAVMVDAIPERFGSWQGLATSFAMARGTAETRPLELTKWFNTNYHYLVPELDDQTSFTLRPEAQLAQLDEARQVGGAIPRPVILGPLSFVLLSKTRRVSPVELLDPLAGVYGELLRVLRDAGATEVQVDEPCLVVPRAAEERDALESVWARLTDAADVKLTLATYFEGLDTEDGLARVLDLPADEFHLDVVEAPEQLEPALEILAGRHGVDLSLGVIDGRNVWVTDLDRALSAAERAADRLGDDRVTLAPSCSLLHVPYRAADEEGIAPEIRAWLAFGEEKLGELVTLARAVEADPDGRDELLADNRRVRTARQASTATNNPAVRERVAALRPVDYERGADYATRRATQADRLQLPPLPTTTIGSYPQTSEIRHMRAGHRRGELDIEEYETFLRDQVKQVVTLQEEVGLDVLVHGEPERNDMVEYFADQLEGFALSSGGWVQSYGSRCVRPPILYGDVSRRELMTVRWWRHAQSLTDRPVKGVVTGPVTILQWSFVRDDQPLADTCRQLALAIRDEVADLDDAGAPVIQIDEAAFREGLPLHPEERGDYLAWAVDCFRLAAAGASPATQVHAHMCYSNFHDIVDHVARLDADVLLIEASRSGMELLESFGRFGYPKGIGPGVYDIHSPRVPPVEEMEELLAAAEQHLDRDQLWVNPDCGLKTRSWEDIRPALANLVEAARRARDGVTAAP